MRLYAGYDMLGTNDGPSAVAYAALRRACDRLTTVVVAERDDRGELERLSGQRDTPVFVTDDGRVYTGVRAIAVWAGSRCG
jgi:hypothetical protein